VLNALNPSGDLFLTRGDRLAPNNKLTLQQALGLCAGSSTNWPERCLYEVTPPLSVVNALELCTGAENSTRSDCFNSAQADLRLTDIQAMYLCEDVRAPNPPTVEIGDEAFSMLSRMYAEVDEDRQNAQNPDTWIQDMRETIAEAVLTKRRTLSDVFEYYDDIIERQQQLTARSLLLNQMEMSLFSHVNSFISMLKVWTEQPSLVNLQMLQKKVALFDDKFSNAFTTINDDYQTYVQPEQLSIETQDSLWDILQQKELMDRWVLREGDLRTFFGRMLANLTASSSDEASIAAQMNTDRMQDTSNYLHSLQVNLDAMGTAIDQDISNLQSSTNKVKFIQLLTDLMRTVQSVLGGQP